MNTHFSNVDQLRSLILIVGNIFVALYSFWAFLRSWHPAFLLWFFSATLFATYQHVIGPLGPYLSALNPHLQFLSLDDSAYLTAIVLGATGTVLVIREYHQAELNLPVYHSRPKKAFTVAGAILFSFVTFSVFFAPTWLLLKKGILQ